MIRQMKFDTIQDLVEKIKQDEYLTFGSILIGSSNESYEESTVVYRCEQHGNKETICHPRLWEKISGKKINVIKTDFYYGDDKYWVEVEGFDYDSEIKIIPLKPTHVKESNDYVCPRCVCFGKRFIMGNIPPKCPVCGQLFDSDDNENIENNSKKDG